MANDELWRAQVAPTQPADGTIRHGQLLTTYGPGALVDFVESAAIVAGLSWWAKGPRVVEDRLLAMLRARDGFERVELFAPPASPADPDAPDRKWIRAFLFPQWFVCQNEHCWSASKQRDSRDRPRRLISAKELDRANTGTVSGHRCANGRGAASPVQPVRFVRACPRGHLDDIPWNEVVHQGQEGCRPFELWMDEAGASGDLSDLRVRFAPPSAAASDAAATRERYRLPGSDWLYYRIYGGANLLDRALSDTLAPLAEALPRCCW